MRKRKNETNACNDFITILHEIKGVEYIIKCRPEESNSKTEDVDFILAPKNKKVQLPKIAVEHTIVEAHNEQIAYIKYMYKVVEKINQRCQDKLPTNNYFELVIPPALIVDTSKESREQFVKTISGWISDTAETLNADQTASRLYDGHKVWLICGCESVSELNGKMYWTSTRPTDADKERQDRFRRAFDAKLPKLIKYKEKGFATALLLEDISFSHALPKDDWKDLIPTQYHSEFQLKIDYVVIFVSIKKKMIIGNVWKEGSQIYAEIPDSRRFSLRR